MRLTLPMLVLSGLAACSSSVPRPPPDPEAQATAPVRPVASPDALVARLPDGLAPEPGLYVAGQPDEATLVRARDAGVRTVINLRPTAELPLDEASVVQGLGMRYVQIPVATAADLTLANARALDEALGGDGPFLVHCGSGNRVGALFGVRAHLLQGADLEGAVALAKAHGMTKLEPMLREILQPK